MWLQIRIVHRILATNVVLIKMGIVNCSKCTFSKMTKKVLIIFFGSVVKIHNWTGLDKALTGQNLNSKFV